jgi:hypothetical protein
MNNNFLKIYSMIYYESFIWTSKRILKNLQFYKKKKSFLKKLRNITKIKKKIFGLKIFK